jgi:hypothetical protein
MSRAEEEGIMNADFEGKIRSRIEAILINDARNCAEMKAMASEDEPLEVDAFEEERNLYQRIINSYRNAIHEVNHLLEENVGFISGLCRIVESIKDKDDFQEICSRMVDCILQDQGAEFCALAFRPQEAWEHNPLFVEGIREQQQLLFCHSYPTLLGSYEFARVVEHLGEEADDFMNFGDVYREPRFHAIDFPSVVRSMVCLPIGAQGKRTGVLVLSHSLPHFFTPNHVRVLKILASMTSHLQLLTNQRIARAASTENALAEPDAPSLNSLSLILLHFESDGARRHSSADRDLVRRLIRPLTRVIEGKESILPYEQHGILVLLPGTPKDRLMECSSRLRAAFESWKKDQGSNAKSLRMTFGHATCENGEELSRMMEMAGQMVLAGPEDDENQ